MFRLTREVRFAINAEVDPQANDKPANSYAGHPALTGFGQFFSLSVTLRGELRPESSYLRNIKDVDDAVRKIAIPLLAQRVSAKLKPAESFAEISSALR